MTDLYFSETLVIAIHVFFASEKLTNEKHFLAFSNGDLEALYDRSEGFFRRQLILQTKRKPPGREDDPFLSDKLKQEIEGIFLWCLEGLKRLQSNNYKFTVSQISHEKSNHLPYTGG